MSIVLCDLPDKIARIRTKETLRLKKAMQKAVSQGDQIRDTPIKTQDSRTL